MKNMYVAEYFYGTYNNHTARRDRKLLLTKKELRKIESAARNNGFTIIPTRLFINDKGLAKVVVAIARRNMTNATLSRNGTTAGRWIVHLNGNEPLWIKKYF